LKPAPLLPHWAAEAAAGTAWSMQAAAAASKNFVMRMEISRSDWPSNRAGGPAFGNIVTVFDLASAGSRNDKPAPRKALTLFSWA
jgi:hypothetical protein